jgi:hypothetical protein
MARTRREITWLLALGLAAVVTTSGCGIEDTDVPPLTGPSELGLAVRVTAHPDVLTQDGVSTSQIVVELRDENNQPVAGRAVRLDIFVAIDSHNPNSGFMLKDEGELSTKSPVTGGDGRASVTYTAPLGAPKGNTLEDEKLIEIAATPAGSDYSAALGRRVRLRLVPRGTIIE